MHVNAMFPSKYVKASDLADGDQTVTIAGITTEEVGSKKEPKPVMYFEHEDGIDISTKGLVVNKINANTIAKLHGPETRAWKGKPITLAHAFTDMNGEQVECVRVRPPSNKAKSTKPVSHLDAGFDDDAVPF